MSGGSYESSNDQRVHFGLGQATSVSDVEIHWLNGPVEHIKLPSMDRIFMIEEGKGVIPSVYDQIASDVAAKRIVQAIPATGMRSSSAKKLTTSSKPVNK